MKLTCYKVKGKVVTRGCTKMCRKRGRDLWMIPERSFQNNCYFILTEYVGISESKYINESETQHLQLQVIFEFKMDETFKN